MTKCADCPAAGRCVVEATGHTPFCGWARAGGVRRDRVREMSDGPDAPEIPAAPAGPPTVVEAVALVAAARRCPFRSVAGCGCSGARCGLRGGATVSVQECMACCDRYPDPAR